MARPLGAIRAVRETTIANVREELLMRARGRNLSPRTIEWYERHTLGFAQWANSRLTHALQAVGRPVPTQTGPSRGRDVVVALDSA